MSRIDTTHSDLGLQLIIIIVLGRRIETVLSNHISNIHDIMQYIWDVSQDSTRCIFLQNRREILMI